MTWHHLGRDTHSCSLQIIIEYFWLRKGIFWPIPFEYTTSCNPSPFSVGMTCVLVLTNRIWQMSWCVTHLITLHYTRLFCLQACSSYLHDEITGHIGEVQIWQATAGGISEIWAALRSKGKSWLFRSVSERNWMLPTALWTWKRFPSLGRENSPSRHLD